jgi:predicted amino acid racemase
LDYNNYISVLGRSSDEILVTFGDGIFVTKSNVLGGEVSNMNVHVFG